MIRFILALFISGLIFSSQAIAGFEWVPPMNNPMPPLQEVIVPAPNEIDMGSAFPAPSVSAEPLSNDIPMTILPNQPEQSRAIVPPVKTKNLSGRKLLINPYPLRNEAPVVTNNVSMSEVYKAMNEEAGKLHPVKLGAGMTTGAKKKTPYVPRAVRTSSSAHKTFLTPTGTGITPMLGVEPPPLPGMGIPRAPVVKASVPHKIYAEAIGFGRDLPLAMALSQVIPSEFTHSFAKDVDAGAAVSWEGGKSWDQVLNDMLSPKNLTAVIQDNQVIIQPMAKL